MRLRARPWLAALAGLVLVALIAAGAPALGARLAGFNTPLSSYKLIGAHPMLTVTGYRNRLKHSDYLGVGSVPVGSKLIYGGGRVLTSPRVYLTFWDWQSDPVGEEPYLKAFFGGLGGNDWIKSQQQYCQHVTALATSCAGGDPIRIPANELAGTWDDHVDRIPANPLLEPEVGNAPQLSDEVLRAVAHFGYDPNGVYFIATPHGISTSGFAANGGGYCAWHAALQLADGSHVAFANFPYVADAGSGCGQNYVNSGQSGLLDSASMASGHEYAEAMTDPDATFDSVASHNNQYTGWYDPSPVGGENGDKCAYPLLNQTGVTGLPGEAADITLNGRQFAVQPLWSNDANNDAGGCVIDDTPPAASPPDAPQNPATAAVNTSPAACPGAQVVDLSGDAVDPMLSENVAYNDQTSLDILNVQFSTPDPGTLRIKTTLNNLQPFPQGDTLGGLWSVYFDYGGQTYVASVASDATGTMYMDGVHTAAPQAQVLSAVIFATAVYNSGASDVYSNTNDTGSFNPGPDGSVVIDVPLAHIGAGRGAVLAKPWAVSYGTLGNAVVAGAPALPAAGNHWLIFPSDEAPDSNPLEAGNPFNAGPYTGWPYTVGSKTDCATVRKLPAPPVDNIPAPKPVLPPRPVCDGTDLITAAPGNAVNRTPAGLAGADASSVDITAVSFALDKAARTVTTTLTIANLTQTPMAGSTYTYYNVIFKLPDGKTYATQAVLPDPLGLTFGAGTWDTGKNQFISESSETGTVNYGPNGTISVTAKLADLGSASPSAQPLVTDPYANTLSGEGALGTGEYFTNPDDRAPSTGFGPAWPVCKAPAAVQPEQVTMSGQVTATAAPSTGAAGAAAAPAGQAAASAAPAGPAAKAAPAVHAGTRAPRQVTRAARAATAAVRTLPVAAVAGGIAGLVLLGALAAAGWLAYRRRLSA